MKKDNTANGCNRCTSRRNNRFVFEFFDGERDRRIDAWKTLLAIGAAVTPEKMRAAASGAGGDVSELLSLFRRVAAVPEWTPDNERGLTDGELLEVVNNFFDSVNAEKKSTKPKAILQQSTEPESVTCRNGSDSGSGLIVNDR